MMIAQIRAAGATQVIQEGKSLKEAIAHLQEVIPGAQARGEEAVYVPPFDHEDV
jgi:L-serine/L-threonine ammonia-lyase